MQTNTVWFHLYEVTRTLTFRVRKYVGRFQGLGGALMFNEDSFSLGRWEIQETDNGENCNVNVPIATEQCERTYCHWMVLLNTVKIVCFILCDFTTIKILKNKHDRLKDYVITWETIDTVKNSANGMHTVWVSYLYVTLLIFIFFKFFKTYLEKFQSFKKLQK